VSTASQGSSSRLTRQLTIGEGRFQVEPFQVFDAGVGQATACQR